MSDGTPPRAVSSFEQLAEDVASNRPDDEATEYVADTLLHLGSDREVILSGCHEPVKNGADQRPYASESLRFVLHTNPVGEGSHWSDDPIRISGNHTRSHAGHKNSEQGALKTYGDLRADSLRHAGSAGLRWLGLIHYCGGDALSKGSGDQLGGEVQTS